MFGVSESWLKPDLPTSMISIDGFSVVRNDRCGRRGGGVCIYIQNRLQYDLVPELSVSTKNLEMIGIIISGNSNFQKKVLIVLVYRPPSSDSSEATALIVEKIWKLLQ